MRFIRHVALVVAAAAASSVAAAQSPKFHVARRIEAGGEGGWDYLTVDTIAHRLYISRSTHVQVIDLDAEKVVGDIGNTPGVHGIAIAGDLGRGFISNGRDSSVTIFDLKSLAVLGSARTGRNPDAILYEPSSRRVFAFNGGSNSATAIDAATGKVVGTVALNGRPEFATADGTGRVFVNLEDSSAVAAFDARTLAVTARWPLAPCEEPSGMAIDRAHGLVFSGCSNKLMTVTDTRTGKVLGTATIGSGVDANAFDVGHQVAFSSNGDGTLTLVHIASPTEYHQIGSVTTAPRAKTMALDERTHRVYVPVAQYGEVPAATATNPRPRAPMVPGSFAVLVLEP